MLFQSHRCLLSMNMNQELKGKEGAFFFFCQRLMYSSESTHLRARDGCKNIIRHCQLHILQKRTQHFFERRGNCSMMFCDGSRLAQSWFSTWVEQKKSHQWIENRLRWDRNSARSIGALLLRNNIHIQQNNLRRIGPHEMVQFAKLGTFKCFTKSPKGA